MPGKLYKNKNNKFSFILRHPVAHLMIRNDKSVHLLFTLTTRLGVWDVNLEMPLQ